MTNTTPQRQRVLIIGSGGRVQNNFLPVLACLKNDFEVVGIHSRTEERLRPVAERWNVPAVLRLEEFDFSSVDVVAISIPPDQNAAVVKQLLAHAPRLRLVIDTPVACNLGQLWAITPLLDKFSKVIVAEDYMNFPQFALLRKLAGEKTLGRLKAATLYNIGYRHHGLALIRSFIGFKPVLRSWRHSTGTFSAHTGYSFTNGFRAGVIGPYRPHANGGIMLEGSEGVVTETDSDSSFGRLRGRQLYKLVRLYENNLLSGFALDGQTRLHQIDLPALSQMRAMAFEDKSDLNLLRGCGLMEVFRALIDEKNINNVYGAQNAVYDFLVSKWATRGLMPVDPLALVGRSMVGGVRVLSRLR